MYIERVHIKNFRSIVDIEVVLQQYMVFVGKNNSGKSNILKALNVFFNGDASDDDFRKDPDGNVSDTITIEVEFTGLDDGEKVFFHEKNVHEDEKTGNVIISLAIKKSDKKPVLKYSCVSCDEDPDDARNLGLGWFFDGTWTSITKLEADDGVPADFKALVKAAFEASGQKRLTKPIVEQAKTKYKESSTLFNELKTKQSMKEWKGGGEELGDFFFIPAVQNIEDETSFTGTGDKIINKLMNHVLEQINTTEEMNARNAEIKDVIDKIYKINEDNSPLKQIEATLNQTLSGFSGSRLYFNPEVPSIKNLVRASLAIHMVDDVDTDVQSKGHGLQRYFLVALFKALSEALPEIKNAAAQRKKEAAEARKRKKSKASTTGEGPDADDTPGQPAEDMEGESSRPNHVSFTCFAIEEPELFLHPQFQRMMQGYLRDISFQLGNQVLLNTHAPSFIRFGTIEEIVVVRKKNIMEGTTARQMLFKTYDGMKTRNKIVTWGQDPEEKEKRAGIFLVNMDFYLNADRNAMFFADKVVLVEGQTEKMMFEAFADYFYPHQHALLSSVTYIECFGKPNLQQYINLLKKLDIPYFVVCDTDRGTGSLGIQNMNIHVKKEVPPDHFFELDPDFEGTFDIEGELDDSGKKKNKPYYAYAKFFDQETGEPIKSEFDELKNQPVLKSLFKALYGIEPGIT